ncbi:MAG TPA: hypothetical protein ENN57_00610 [Chloroflexi bacterium]|nr:hypothetical protein [Chloroflexota bacterium]
MCIPVFGYRATDRAVEITLFGLPVRKIPFSNIADIAHGSKGTFGEVWVFKLWHLVTIIKKEGGLKYVTLSPREPAQFVDEVKERLKKFRANSPRREILNTKYQTISKPQI